MNKFLKKLLAAALFIPALSFADPVGPSGTQIRQIQDEGVGLTRREKLNFTGSGVNCVDNAGNLRTDCTITAGGGGASSLEAFNNFDGTRSSPTASIGLSDAFRGTVSGSTYTFRINFSSVASKSDLVNVSGYRLEPATVTPRFDLSAQVGRILLSTANVNALQGPMIFVSSVTGGQQFGILVSTKNINDIQATAGIFLTPGSTAQVDVSLGGSSAMTVSSQAVSVNSRRQLRLGDSDNSNYAGLVAPTILATNLIWRLPLADASGCLSSDGSGNLSITTCGSGSGGSPGLPVSSVQLNGGGVFIGTASLTMNTTSNTLSIGANTTFTNVTTTTLTNVSTITFGNGTALFISTSANLSLLALTSQPCIGTDANGKVQAGTCGGGGSSSLEVFSNFDGTRSSPTASIALGDAMKLSVSGSTASITVDFSSITAKGNTFNTGSNLVQLSGGLIPNSLIDGSSVTKQGLLVAGSNITLTPGAGTLTIASSGGGGATVNVTPNSVLFSTGGTTISGDSGFQYDSAGSSVSLVGTLGIQSSAPHLRLISSGVPNFTRDQIQFYEGFTGSESLTVSIGNAGTSGASVSSQGGITIQDATPTILAQFPRNGSSYNYMRTGLHNDGGFAFPTNVQSSNFTASINAYYYRINAAGGPVTMTFPALSAAATPTFTNVSYLACKSDSSTNAVSFAATGDDNGDFSKTLNTQDDCIIWTSSTNASVGTWIPAIVTRPATTVIIGTGTASNFTNSVTSITTSVSLLGTQFQSVANGTTNFISLNLSSVTVEGKLIAGSNITLTPGVGTLTIASTGGGGGMTPGSTNYIQNINSLQTGATFYVSSGTVSGVLTVTNASGATSDALIKLQAPGTGFTTVTPLLEVSGGDFSNPFGKLGSLAFSHYANGIRAFDFNNANDVLVFRVGLDDTFGRSMSLSSTATYRFYDADNTNYVAFKASNTITADKTWTLPAADGTSGQALVTNGSGNLSFATISGGGGGGASTLAVGTGTASNFTNNVTSPTAAISFLGGQFNSIANGTTNFISLDLSSVTAQGVITATTSMSVSQTPGVLTIGPKFNMTFLAADSNLPGANAPYISNSTSSSRAALFFDESSTQTVTWAGKLFPFRGNTLSAEVVFLSSATSGTMNWGVYVECITPSVDAVSGDTDSFGVVNSTSVTVGGTSLMANKAVVSLSNQDSCSEGDAVRFKLERRARESDTAVGAGRVWYMNIYEQ